MGENLMAAPWEQYQTQPTTEEAPAAEAPPVEMAQPAQTAQPAAPVEAEEGPWTKYAAPAPVEAKKVEAPVAEDAGKKWAEEHPIAGRVLSAIHGAGELVPGREKLSAGLHAITDFGQGSFEEKYERAKRAQERAGKVLSEAYPGAHLVGELAPMLTPAGAETMLAGEGLVGKGIGKALPFLGETGRKVAGVSGFGGLYGAAQGAAEGDTSEERIKNAISGGTLGAALGPVGMGVGSAAKNIFGKVGKTATEEAASRLGPEIEEALPKFIGRESPVQGVAAAGLRAIPFVGDKIAAASEHLNSVLGKKILSIAGSSEPNRALAGSKMRTGINKWIGEDSKKTLNKLYENVEDAFQANKKSLGLQPDQSISHPILETQNMASWLESEAAQAKGDPGFTSAIDMVREAINDPSGMTYRGLLSKRQQIGDALKDGELVAGSHKEIALKNLYKSLTNDLRAAIKREGGQKGLMAFNKAENEYKLVNAKRSLLRKVVGAGDIKYSDEAVLDNLANMIKNNRGDIRRLNLVKETLSPTDWNQVVSEMVHTIGYQEDALGKGFSPAKFLTAYSKMAPRAREVLFGKPGTGYRQNIDDIAQLAKASVSAGEGINKSKTAHVTETLKMFDKLGLAGKAAFGIGAAGVAAEGAHQVKEGDWGTLASELGGGYMLATLLASPRGSFAIKKWMETGSPAAGKALTDEISRIMGAAPKAAQYATQTNLTKNMANREERASGGKVGKRDYPAKRLNKMERAARRAQQAIALETTPLMEKPDEQIAQALRIAKGE